MRPAYKRRGLTPLEAGRRRQTTVAFGNLSLTDPVRKTFSNGTGLTLVELVLAILLLSVVILTGISMELGTRHIFSSTDTETQLLQEAAPIMTLVSKVINRGIGQNSSYPFVATVNANEGQFTIRVDSNNNGMADAGDVWVYFRFLNNSGGIQHQLRYYPDNTSASYQSLSQRVIFFNITNPVDGFSNITLTLRKDPNNSVNSANPEVTVQSNAQYREFSIS